MDPATVRTVLLRTMSADNDERRLGESQLQEMAAMGGFAPVLAALAVTGAEEGGAAELHVRQSAGIFLKKLVKECWTCDEPGGVVIGEADKAAVRATIPAGLGDASAKIRTATGLVVSAVGNHDFPEEWPTLFEDIVGAIQSEDLDLVHGAMQCLSFFADHLDHSVLPQVAPTLFPHLFTVFCKPGQYSPEIRCCAASVMHACFAVLNTSNIAPDSNSAQLLQALLPNWIRGLLGESMVPGIPIGANTASASESGQVFDGSELSVQMEALRMISLLVSGAPKLIKPYLPSVLGVLWRILPT